MFQICYHYSHQQYEPSHIHKFLLHQEAGAYLDNFRNIWDLYITDSSADAKTLSTSTGDESKAMLVEKKAVFYQNGSWEYASLVEAGLTNLAMIPIYCGVEGEEKAGLCSGTENCWAVNAKASEADQKASLDFLYWLVTDAEASQVVVDQLGAIPFKSAPNSANGFLANGTIWLPTATTPSPGPSTTLPTLTPSAPPWSPL